MILRASHLSGVQFQRNYWIYWGLRSLFHSWVMGEEESGLGLTGRGLDGSLHTVLRSRGQHPRRKCAPEQASPCQ